MKKLCLVVLVILSGFYSYSQPSKRTTIPEYISKYKDDAVKDMMKMGVPASITLAQGILESESGNSALAREANNHFGIKCHNDWTGDTYHQDDDAKDECFRKYNHVLESFDDHGRFLRERPRYAFLFDHEITDYKGWARGLKSAGYATNPRYAELLIKLIEDYDLDQFDRGGKKIPVTDTTPQIYASKPPSQKPEKSNNPEKNTHKHTKEQTARNQRQVKNQSTKSAVNANDVPYVTAQKGDSWISIAMSNDMRLWQILKYNDATSDDELNPGDVVYLKPKRGKPVQEFHIVTNDDETLWQISQKYGIKLKKLIKLNEFSDGAELSKGQKVKLK